jgi:hypothetical protein
MKSKRGKKRSSQTEKRELAIRAVHERAEAQALFFFHDERRTAFATVPVSDHRETWKIRSRDFRLWIMAVLHEKLGAAPKSLITRCLEEFETYAICRGATLPVNVRIAHYHGDIYIDLANDQWQAIQITESGWHVLDESPAKFCRPMGMLSLPHPRDGGCLRDISQFLNVGPQSEILLLTWLSYALLPDTPYPIVALSGAQGSGKSTITRIMRALIDPSFAPLTTIPRSERDLAIAASNGHLITMDNLSEIPPALSDAMCRIATGGSFRTRQLYTDDSEMIFTYRRPLVINGIEELPIRADLLDRAILIHVEPIADDTRRDESSFWRDFENMRPRLFGSLLDIIRIGIIRLRDVKLSSVPRMADFARWGVAVEEPMGFAKGAFLATYLSNREDAHVAALDSSPIAEALCRFLECRHVFHGTALVLLNNLRLFLEGLHLDHPEIGQLLRHPKFPRAPNQLSAELARIEPNLAKRGITVERGRSHNGRFLHLRRITEDAGRKRDDHVNCNGTTVTTEPLSNETETVM